MKYSVIMSLGLMLVMIMAVAASGNPKTYLAKTADNQAVQNAGEFHFANLSKASAELGMKLYREEANKSDDNLLFSPFSVQTALSMVALGAKGSTLQQIMSLYDNSSLTIGEMKKLLKMTFPLFKSTENVTIETAEYINGWVKEKTHNKIKDLIKPSFLNDLTKMVLVNALYFKGLWYHQFETNDTKKDDFVLANGDTVKANFMVQTEVFNVGHHDGHAFVALPYSGGTLVMYLFTPNPLRESRGQGKESNEEKSEEEAVPLSELENILTLNPKIISEKLNMDSMEPMQLKLELPRFKIEAKVDLKEDLQNLGVTSMFDKEEADLSGITGKKILYVHKALHKAMLEVNEGGSEGAAATAVIINRLTSSPFPPKQARFDRPFIFFIKDERSGMILFQGRVMNPTL